MAIYTKGESTSIAGGGWQQVAPANAKSGVVIMHFKAAPVSFRLISAATMNTLLEGWLRIKSELAKQTGRGDVLNIRGILINTDTGDIWIKADIKTDKGATQTQQAGVGPYAIVAIVAALFGALAVAITVIGWYAPTETKLLGGGNADPCTTPGFVNNLRCTVNRASWITVGIGFGAVAMVVFLIVTTKKS